MTGKVMSIYSEIGAAQIAVTTVQSLLIILNIAGNTLVCVIIVKNKDMRTSMNYLLVNLAVADMTVATFLAVRYIFIHTFTHPDGVTGLVLCSLLTGGNVAWVGAGSSVFTLVAIATERYYTVMYPYENKGKLTNRKLKVIIFCSWIFGVIISLPMFLVRNFDKKRDACVLAWPEEWMSKAYSVAWFLFTSFIPVCLMIALYSRVVYTLWVKQRNQARQQAVMKLRKRVTSMVITVSAIFGVTWLTDTTNHVLYSFIPSYSFLTYAATSILLLFNCAINPLVYALISQRFRTKVNGMMCCSCRPASGRMQPARERQVLEVSVVTLQQAVQKTDESSKGLMSPIE